MANWKSIGKSATALADPPEDFGATEGSGEQKQWVLRFKKGNHPAESGLIMASSREKAEEVGRAWCIKESVGLMQGVRFISVSDPILADESILG